MTNRRSIFNSPIGVASGMMAVGADREAIAKRRVLVGTGGGELS